MGSIGALYMQFRELLAQPMEQALIFLNAQLTHIGIPSWGLTIILFTILVKLIFAPLTMKQLRSSRAMQALQPQLEALKKQHGKDKQRLMEEQMRLYKENRVNPAAGCLPMLVQFPIWIGLYQALFAMGAAHMLNQGFLWIPSLANKEGFPYVLSILSGASQFVVQRMMMVQTTDSQQKSMQQAMQFMPIMYVFFAFQMPAGLVLYWVASNLFAVAQQYFVSGFGGIIPGRPVPVLALSQPSRVLEPVETLSPSLSAPAMQRRAKKRRK